MGWSSKGKNGIIPIPITLGPIFNPLAPNLLFCLRFFDFLKYLFIFYLQILLVVFKYLNPGILSFYYSCLFSCIYCIRIYLVAISRRRNNKLKFIRLQIIVNNLLSIRLFILFSILKILLNYPRRHTINVIIIILHLLR